MTVNLKSQNLKSWLDEAVIKLKSAGIDSGKLDAEILASHCLKKPRTWLHAHSEYQLSKSEQQLMNNLLIRRLDSEPIAYIIGSKEFFGRDFIVSSDVLVPRPESEDFIEIAKRLPKRLTFIDIGTGSGILAISAVLEQPSWTGRATDINPAAIKVAQKNALKLGAKKILFKRQDLLADDSDSYNLVFANLPYVPTKLRGKPDIAREPEIALFAGNDGLDLYRQLFQQLADRAQKPEFLLCESLIDQHKSMEILADNARYRLVQTSGLIQHYEYLG